MSGTLLLLLSDWAWPGRGGEVCDERIRADGCVFRNDQGSY